MAVNGHSKARSGTLTTALVLGMVAGLAMFDAATREAFAAGSVESAMHLGGLNRLSDADADRIGFDADGDGFLDVGDTLRGIVNIISIKDDFGGGGTNILGGGSFNELSGIFEVEVVSKIFVSELGGAASDGIDEKSDLYDYVFQPFVGFAAELAGYANVDPVVVPANAMLAFFEDPAADFDETITPVADAEATATGGILRWILGFGGENETGTPDAGTGAVGDELWRARAPHGLDVANIIASGIALGFFDIQLSILYNGFVGVGFDQVATIDNIFEDPLLGFIDVRASGILQGSGGAVGDFDIASSVQFFVSPVATPIPEPTTLGLMGLGLLGFGALSRRRRKRMAR